MSELNNQNDNVKAPSKADLLRCSICESPVVKSSACCNVCKTPLTGAEVTYSVHRPESVTIKPLLIQLLIVWFGIWIFSGPETNAWLSLLWVLATSFYGWKIFKRLV